MQSEEVQGCGVYPVGTIVPDEESGILLVPRS